MPEKEIDRQMPLDPQLCALLQSHSIFSVIHLRHLLTYFSFNFDRAVLKKINYYNPLTYCLLVITSCNKAAKTAEMHQQKTMDNSILNQNKYVTVGSVL
jgi:hypothetical protein